MPRFRFDHEGPEGEPFEVPGGRRVTHMAPPAAKEPAPLEELVRQALLVPHGSPRLRDAARRARHALVLVDDHTRATPAAKLLPHVRTELQKGGVADEDVTVLIALGTHRRMTDAEVRRKVGEELCEAWSVIQHDYRDPAVLREYEATPDGMPVTAHRALDESDLVVGVGHVGVHGLMGYSGGAKIVFPGICGEATETWTHWGSLAHETRDLMGRADNPLRRNIEEAARRVGLDAVLNVVFDAAGRVQRVAYGDFVRAHRFLAARAAEHWTVRAPGPAAVVIVQAAPADADYWQSIKGLYAANLMASPGAHVVLVAPNPEGVADNHPNVLDLAGLPLNEIRRRVDAGEVEDVVGASVAAHTARARERYTVHLVSTGIPGGEAKRLGFRPHARVQEAVDAACEEAPPGDVVVVERGGAVLPQVPRHQEGREAEPVGRPRHTGGTRT